MTTKAVLFDAVGTLIVPCPAVDEAYAAVGAEHGFSLPASRIKQRFRTAYRRHFTALATDEAQERARWKSVVDEVFETGGDSGSQQLFDALWNHFADAANWRVYPDVEPVWRDLQRRGIRIYVASNFDRRLERICAELPPLGEATGIFCSSQIGFSKPHPSFFSGVQQALGLRGERLLLIGDDLTRDYQAARTAGWRAVHLARDDAARLPESIGSLAALTV